MSLLEKLRRAGTLDSQGQFTIDVGKAKAKMARFQLTDPSRYILELVAAAVANGARAIRIQEKPFEFRFDGQPLAKADLARLDDFLFGSDTESQALRHLAVALNALRQLDFSEVRVESPAGAVLVRNGSEDQLQTGPFKENAVRVRSALLGFGASPWSRATRELVAERCRYLDLPLTVEGEALPRESSSQIKLLQRAGALSVLTLIRLGVVVAERQENTPIPFTAVVRRDDLRLNASHSDVVEDEIYQALLEECRNKAERRFDRLAKSFSGAPETRDFLLAMAPHPSTRSCPLFPLVGGGFASVQDLDTQSRSLGGSIPVAEKSFDFQPEGLQVVQLGSGPIRRALEAFFGSKRLDNVESRLLDELRTRANRARWEASPRPATLPPGSWLVRRALDLKECQGEVGLDVVQGRGATLHVLYQGRLLCTKQLPNESSYLAVLDFPDLNIDATWSGPADPRFDRAVAQLKKSLPELYAELANRDWQESVQSVREHLLECVAGLKDRLPEPILSAGLFFDAKGGTLSVADLRKAGRVATLPLEAELPAVPPEALPDHPIVIADDGERAVLEELLGKRQVGDFSSQLPRLRKLAQRVQDRQEPVLSGNYLLTVRFHQDGVKGELGLVTSGKSRVRLLREGVHLEDRELPAPGPACEAVVDSPALTPNERWNAVQNDDGWQQVKRVLREAQAQACRALVKAAASEGSGPPERRRALLKIAASRPELTPLLGSLPLFRPVQGRAALSVTQLKEEQERHGQVLYDSDDALPGRLLLKTPSKLETRALKALFPECRLEPARPLILRMKAQETFLRRRTVAEIKVPSACLVRADLPAPFRGQVGLLREGGRGWLRVYHQDRLLAERQSELPERFCAAFTHPELLPTEEFDDVSNLGKVLSALHESCGELALELARARSDQVEFLFELFSWSGLAAKHRGELEQLEFVPLLGEGRASLRQLRQRYRSRKQLRVVLPTAGPPQDPPVVMLPRHLWDTVAALLGKKARDFSKRLEQHRELAARLAGLSRRLPPCLVQVPVCDEHWTGTVGVPIDPGDAQLVFFRGDEPVARADSPGLVACGVLEGEVGRSRDSLEAELSREQKTALKALSLKAYHALEPLYSRLRGKQREQARHRLLECLMAVRHQLGGTGPDAELAGRLMDTRLLRIPLRQWVSLSQLVDEAQERGRVLFLESDRWPPAGEEGLLPILPRGSLERQLCLDLVGKELMAAWEPTPREPLVDREAVRERVRGVYRWGVTAVAPAKELLRQTGSQLRQGIAQALSVKNPFVGKKKPEQSQDTVFLSAIRREFAALVPRKPRAAGRKLVEQLEYSLWPLGPAVHWDSQGRLRLNRANGLIRWIREHYEDDPAALVTLVVHLFCRINHRLDSISPEQEREFLLELGQSLRTAFSDESP